MTSLEAALRQIGTDLARARVSFALVGGLAVSVRTEPRFTRDADLAVALASDAEAEALIYEPRAHDYRIEAIVEQEAVGRLATARLTFSSEPRAPVIDLLFASSGIEPEVVADAEPIELLPDLTMGVARTGHLIALKVLSRDDVNRPQDLVDLRALLRVASPAELGRARDSLALIAARGYHRGREPCRRSTRCFPPRPAAWHSSTMFERYTEEARQALFFARYEASQRGSISIESDHLLLALIRETRGPVNAILAHFQVMPLILLREIDARAPLKERVPPSVWIPFSQEVQHVLNVAREEADRLRHTHIGPEHLFLGLLNEDQSVAESVLTQQGITLDAARDHIATLPAASASSTTAPVDGRLQVIKLLVEQLRLSTRSNPTCTEVQHLGAGPRGDIPSSLG